MSAQRGKYSLGDIEYKPLGDDPISVIENEAKKFGLRVSSGARSQASNKAAGGAPSSKHLVDNARDLAGDPQKMSEFYRHMRATYGPNLAELYYDPEGGFKKGKDIGAIGGHGDHVHASVAQRGQFKLADAQPAQAQPAPSPEFRIPSGGYYQSPAQQIAQKAVSQPAPRMTPRLTDLLPAPRVNLTKLPDVEITPQSPTDRAYANEQARRKKLHPYARATEKLADVVMGTRDDGSRMSLSEGLTRGTESIVGAASGLLGDIGVLAAKPLEAAGAKGAGDLSRQMQELSEFERQRNVGIVPEIVRGGTDVGLTLPALPAKGAATILGTLGGARALARGESLPEAIKQGVVSGVGIAGGGALASRIATPGLKGLAARSVAGTVGMEIPQIAATGHIPTVEEVIPDLLLQGGLEVKHGLRRPMMGKMRLPDTPETVDAQIEALRSGEGAQKVIRVETVPEGLAELGLTATKTPAGTFIHSTDTSNPLSLTHKEVREIARTAAVSQQPERAAEEITRQQESSGLPAQSPTIRAKYPPLEVNIRAGVKPKEAEVRGAPDVEAARAAEAKQLEATGKLLGPEAFPRMTDAEYAAWKASGKKEPPPTLANPKNVEEILNPDVAVERARPSTVEPVPVEGKDDLRFHDAVKNTQAVLDSGVIQPGGAGGPNFAVGKPFTKPRTEGLIFTHEGPVSSRQHIPEFGDEITESSRKPLVLTDSKVDILYRNTKGETVSVKDAYSKGTTEAELIAEGRQRLGRSSKQPPTPKPVQRGSEVSATVGARKATPEGAARVEAARQQLRDVINNPDLVGKQRADAIANGKQLVSFLEANADTRKPLETDIRNGDQIAYTGVTTPDGFREFIYLEGAKAGDYGVTMTKAEKAAMSARKQAERAELQEGFRRLAEPTTTKPSAKPTRFIPESRDEVNTLWNEFKENQRKKRGSGGLDSDDITRLVRIGAYYVREGARDLADFTQRMIEQVGEEARAWAPSIYARAKDLVETGKLQDVTGIKNATVAEERIVRGLTPIETEFHKSFAESRADGIDLVESNPEFRRQVETWSKNPKPLTDAEDAALTYDRMKLHNEHKAAMQDLIEAQKAGDVPAEADALARRDAVEEQMQVNDLVARRTGTENGRGLNARRMMMKEDYSLASLVQKARVANEGNAINAETRAKLEEVSNALEAKIKEFDDYREQASKREMELTAKKMQQQARRKVKVEDLDKEFDALVAQLRGPKQPRGGAEVGTAIVDLETIQILGKMARNRFEKGIVKAEDLASAIHEAVKDSLPGVELRDVRDAISGYGREKKTRSQAVKDFAKVKRELARLSRVEDKASVPGRAKRSVEDVRRQAQQKRLEKRKAQLERQLATGDFSTTPRQRTPLEPEARKIQMEIDDLKQQANTQIKEITTTRLRQQFDPSELDKDVHWYDYVRSPLSNLNFRGTYERVGGVHGYQASEILRQAQVDAAVGDITRTEAVNRARKELAPIQKLLRAGGKPGLAHMLTEHIDVIRDPDAAFRGLAGFLKAFQYHTKLRFNPRATLINELQPLQTLWPHLTTAEFLNIAKEARKPSVRRRIAELADRESGGKVEIKETGTRRLDLFGKASESNRIMGHLAGELLGKRQGMEGPELERYAADWAKKVEFDNSRYDIPPLFRGNLAGVIGQFKPFMVKNIERLVADWKRAPEGTSTGTLARRSKMVLAQVAMGGVRSMPGLKTIGGALILGALAKSFQKTGLDEDAANKFAETVYFGAPGLVEQDLSGSVMIIDEPFGNTPSEKILNFAGGPTLGLIHAAWKEGGRFAAADDAEGRQAAALRLGKAITPLTKTGQTIYSMFKGQTPTMRLGGKDESMTIGEAIGYGLQGTPKRQTMFYDRKDLTDFQRKAGERMGIPVPDPSKPPKQQGRPSRQDRPATRTGQQNRPSRMSQ